MQHDQFQLHAQIEDRHWWFVGRRKIIRRLVAEVVRPSTEAIVVDVGCGTGGNLAALAGRYRCIGIDTSDEAIRLARTLYGSQESSSREKNRFIPPSSFWSGGHRRIWANWRNWLNCSC